MKRPPRLFSETRATQAELLEHLAQWREYSAYLEGRLGIVDTQPVAKATPRKMADKRPIDDPNGAVEMVARSLIKLFGPQEPRT